MAAGDPRNKGKHILEQELEAEPKPDRGLPTCPRHLKGRARAAWIFWAKELATMEIDNRPDAHMLEGACVAYDAAVDAYETVQKQGRFFPKRIMDPVTNTLVIVDLKPHPAVRQGYQAWALMRAFCSEFGLSPVSRMRLAIEKHDNGETDMLEMLARPRERKPVPVVLQ